MCVSWSICVSLGLCVCVSLGLCVSLSLCLCVCVSWSLRFSISLSLHLSISVCVSLGLCLCVCVSWSLRLSISLSLRASPSLLHHSSVPQCQEPFPLRFQEPPSTGLRKLPCSQRTVKDCLFQFFAILPLGTAQNLGPGSVRDTRLRKSGPVDRAAGARCFLHPPPQPHRSRPSAGPPGTTSDTTTDPLARSWPPETAMPKPRRGS